MYLHIYNSYCGKLFSEIVTYALLLVLSECSIVPFSLHILSLCDSALFISCTCTYEKLFPEHFDGGSFAKLFVGSVPRTVTEEDVSLPFSVFETPYYYYYFLDHDIAKQVCGDKIIHRYQCIKMQFTY